MQFWLLSEMQENSCNTLTTLKCYSWIEEMGSSAWGIKPSPCLPLGDPLSTSLYPPPSIHLPLSTSLSPPPSPHLLSPPPSLALFCRCPLLCDELDWLQFKTTYPYRDLTRQNTRCINETQQPCSTFQHHLRRGNIMQSSLLINRNRKIMAATFGIIKYTYNFLYQVKV